MKKDNLEVYLGGMFGFVAIIAIIIELNMEGFVTKALITSVKDIASLGVSFMLFVFTAKHLIPSLNFEKRFSSILNDWFNQMEPLVKRSSSHTSWSNFIEKEFPGKEKQNYVRSFLSVNLSEYFNESLSSPDGEFMFLPEIKQKNYASKEGAPFIIHFAMNRTTFLKNDMIGNKQETSLEALADKICTKFESKYPNSICKPVDKTGDKNKVYIRLSVHQNFITDKEIRELFDMIDYMLFLYAIAA